MHATSLPLIPLLPSVLREPEKGRDVLAAMKGVEIIQIGTTTGQEIEGGGLLIDYRSKDGIARRLVLAFNECGMWVEAVTAL